MTGPASTDAGPGPNPYVGPRPFEPGEALYGREDEITELQYRLSAERIVLLHSPSGAGKSSLVQAGLLPRIRESFDVWGPARVNQEAEAGHNRYVASALQGFEDAVPERLRRPPEVLAGQSLSEYFEKRPRRRSGPKNVLLVFDQFEEVLTVEPLAVDAKREFFDQLGELLQKRQVWALFALREDYLAPLDPYALEVPTHLQNRFRIDLLGLEAARQAIVAPARDGGREFPAAGRLLEDLATVLEQQPDGSFREERGHHVEPVQLQVVCRRLWDAMPADDRSIDAEDLEAFGDVTQALAAYYADSVAALAAGDEARERAVRDWMGEVLIAAGIRAQVRRGAGTSGGLANELVGRLLDTHLVRAEKRAGATWYELAHDRLIEPVRDSNAAWREEHLTDVQRRATLWEDQGRPAGLLLAGAELDAAEVWSDGSVVVHPVELDFLLASREAQAIRDRERRQARRIRRLAVAASLVSVLALAAGVVAIVGWQEASAQMAAAVAAQEEEKRQREAAEEQRQLAEQKEHEAREQERRAIEQSQRAEDEKARADAARQEESRQRAVAQREQRLAEEKEREARRERAAALAARDLAEEAQQEANEAQELAEDQRRRADENAAASERLRRLAEAESLAVRTTSMAEDARLVALLAVQAYRVHLGAGGEAEDPEVHDALRLARRRVDRSYQEIVVSHEAPVRAVAVAGAALASASDDGAVYLTSRGRPELVATVPVELRALAVSPDGERLAAGGADGSIRLWDLARREELRLLAAAGAAVHALAFEPGGPRLAAGSADGLRLLDPDADGGGAPLAAEPVVAVAWSADGGSLAAAAGSRVLLHDSAGEDEEPRVLEADGGLRSVALSRGGRFLAAGTSGGKVLLWQTARLDAGPRELLGHTARVEDIAFHPERPLLASASFDHTLRLWQAERPKAPPVVLKGHASWVWTAAFAAEGDEIYSAGSDGTIRRWTTASALLAEAICRLVEGDLTAAERNQYLPGLAPETTCP